ncbi:MAG: radical SAM protein [Candidatus Aenigmarchaeota archaeon]|nr:radical SAM protein [Candidatus Aenigmarchaeota archaeon]
MKSLYEDIFTFLKDYFANYLSYNLNYPFIKPWRVNFDITHRCPLRCKTCSVWKKNPEVDEELSLEELKKLLEKMKEWGVDHVSFAGGETLVRKNDVIELISLASSMNMRADLITSGYFLDKKTCERLLKAKVSKISISLDGAKRETHDFIRGRGNYDKVIRTAKNLVSLKAEFKSNVELEFTTVVTGYNFRELIDIFNLMQDLGFDYVNYQVITPDNTFTKGLEYYRDFYESNFWINGNDLNLLKRIALKLVKLKKTGKIRNTRDYLLMMPKYFEKKEKFNVGKCIVGFSYLNIDPYGNISVCGLGPNLNVNDGNINNLWNSKEYKKTRFKIKRCKRPCLMLCYERLDFKILFKAWLELRGWLS